MVKRESSANQYFKSGSKSPGPQRPNAGSPTSGRIRSRMSSVDAENTLGNSMSQRSINDKYGSGKR